MKPNRLYALSICLLLLCATALRGQSVRSKANAVRPFYTDSTYDRFTDEYRIALKSRPMIDSARKVSWELIAVCDKNGACEDPIVRMIFSSADGSKAGERMYEALHESPVAIDMLYQTAGGTDREQVYFDGTEARDGKHVGGIFLSQTVDLDELRQAVSLEARVSNLSVRGPTFTITADQLARQAAFWREFDRRSGLASQ